MPRPFCNALNLDRDGSARENAISNVAVDVVRASPQDDEGQSGRSFRTPAPPLLCAVRRADNGVQHDRAGWPSRVWPGRMNRPGLRESSRDRCWRGGCGRW